ncbi:hypothetical protein [Streptomyces sp. OE57]|uniref:hypothetical protein n=1 Tax=Streptomyces lacaronensis TaxID=3379885 RepID=UPI0039B76EE7
MINVKATRVGLNDRRSVTTVNAAKPENGLSRPVRRSSTWTPPTDQREHGKKRPHQPRDLQLHDAQCSLLVLGVGVFDADPR